MFSPRVLDQSTRTQFVFGVASHDMGIWHYGLFFPRWILTEVLTPSSPSRWYSPIDTIHHNLLYFANSSLPYAMASFEQLILQASNTVTARAADHLLLILLYVLTLNELRNLRLVSSTFEHWITTGLPGIFDTVFVDAWYARIKNQSRFGLQFIGAFCKELVINIPTSGAPGTLSPGIVFNQVRVTGEQACVFYIH